MEPVSNAGLKPMTPSERLRYLIGKAPSQEEAVKLILEAADTIQSIQQERDKLIEGLRWFAEDDTWKHPWTKLMRHGKIRAESILKDIGVGEERT